MNVQTLISPGGIEAWFVEDHTDPMVALSFAFDGGSSQVPAGKEGLANLVTLMLELGGGHLAGGDVRNQLDDLAIRRQFAATKDAVVGSIEFLTESRDEAAHFLKLTLTQPHFEPDMVEHARQRLLGFLASSVTDPNHVASAHWDAAAFPGHAYAHSVLGTEATVEEIGAGDLDSYHKRLFAKDALKVVVVGDISVDELGKLLDDVFGDLPTNADLLAVPKVSVALGGSETVIDMDVPRAVTVFGMNAMPRRDPDFVAAVVLNQIAGGDGNSSRLMREICSKRGMAHWVKTGLRPFRHASLFKGHVATRNDMAGRLLDVVREELHKMRGGEISQADLDNAKSYLIGSYPLRFDANAKIAGQLLGLWMHGFGADYVYSRNAMLKAVTLDNLNRVAKRLFKPENLIATIAGRPNLHQARAGAASATTAPEQ